MSQRKKFSQFYANVIECWPDVMDLSDADSLPPNATGHFFPQLSSAWNNAERAFSDSGSLESLMVWSMFGVFHRYAMKYARQGVRSFKLKDIPPKEIEVEFWENLHKEDWSVMIPEYSRE